MTGDGLLSDVLFRYGDLPLGVKMPDSPDNLIKSQISSGSTINGGITGVNGSHSPRPPGGGGTPSPPTEPIRGARIVVKVKRFLSTLQQFASELSSEAGDRVHSLIIGLVSSSISVEDFHHKIQEITNYPLRPFAIPFLKSHLPLLQTELLHFSRLAKQSPQQYLRQNEHSILETLAGLEPPFEIFQANHSNEVHNGKRRSPTNRNGKMDLDYSDSNGDCLPPAKRHLLSPGSRTSPDAGLGLRLAEEHAFRDGRLDRYERFERDFYRPFYGNLSRDYSEDRDMDEEWRNIHTMLNCILGMVEKTKRALCILQHRAGLSNGGAWPSRQHPPPDTPEPKKIAPHFRRTEDRVSEARRRAEEAVKEAKRQAASELQRAAECKAGEMVAAERLRMERLLAEARRQAAEDALALHAQQEESTENCWNCGRKANETCSGCNTARYCGPFCQHKDWESHHRVCGQSGRHSSGPSSAGTPPRTTTDHSPSPTRTSSLVDVKPPKLDI